MSLASYQRILVVLVALTGLLSVADVFAQTRPSTLPIGPISKELLSTIPTPQAQADARAKLRAKIAFYDDPIDVYAPERLRDALKAELNSADLATRYVIFERLHQFYLDAGALEQTLRTIELMSREFQVDALLLDRDALVKTYTTSKSPHEHSWNLRPSLALLKEAMKLRRIDEMSPLFPKILESGKLTDSPFLAEVSGQRVAHLDEVIKSKIAAERILKSDPANRPALETLGWYELLYRLELAPASRRFTKLGDPALLKLVLQDVEAKSVDAKLSVADAWNEYAKSQPIRAARAHMRASMLYEQTIPHLQGVKRRLAEQRLAQHPLPLPFDWYATDLPVEVFTGITIKHPGARVLFLCDSSGSMMKELPQLKLEVSKAVRQLVSSQAFNIIFFGNAEFEIFAKGEMVVANAKNREAVDLFLKDLFCAGSCNPIDVLNTAFDQQPSLIFLLTDGFIGDNDPDDIYKTFHKRNPDRNVKVNAVFLRGKHETDESKATMTLLKRLTSDTSGTLKVIDKSEF